jgi:methylmalonyl-CoA/ethylmalonyl-CoA epimerase
VSIPLYEKLLDTNCYKREFVEGQGVNTAFFRQGESKIELLEAEDADNVINKFIEKKGEGIHHIAFEVEDIYAEIKRLKSEGFQLINEEPKRGADDKLICFLHPKTSGNILIELCMDRFLKPETSDFENVEF